MKGFQFPFSRKKHVAEYKQKHTASAARKISTCSGIPMYWLKFFNRMNSKNAVRAAPKLSTKNNLLGAVMSWCMLFFTIGYLFIVLEHAGVTKPSSQIQFLFYLLKHQNACLVFFVCVDFLNFVKVCRNLLMLST